MSIFSTIIKDVESFASKFEKELAKLWSKAPSVAAVASTVLQFVAPEICKFLLELAGEGFYILDDSAENAHGVLRLLGAT